jgi:hypothetical protein
MHPVARGFREVAGLSRIAPAPLLASYFVSIARHAPEIISGRTLVPADQAQSGIVTVRCNGHPIRIPLDEIGGLLSGKDGSSTFGQIREMYASNVYLRAFRASMRLRSVIDLGSNRGFFQMLAICGYGAEIAIGVEPNPDFSPVAQCLRVCNRVEASRAPRHLALAASSEGDGRITLTNLMQRHGLSSVDFVKCDIEGGEFDVILNDCGGMDRVGNLALELHHDAGDPGVLLAHLTEQGFVAVVTDQFGRRTSGASACYLYASRSGDLLPRLVG